MREGRLWILERVDAVTVKERRAAKGINPRVSPKDGEMENGWRWRERKEGAEEASEREIINFDVWEK